MCNYLLHNIFLENVKTWVRRTTLNGRKREIAVGDKKIMPLTKEDLGQTSNWSKLVAAYLPAARLTIVDRLVLMKKEHLLKRGGKDGCKLRLEVSARCNMFYLFGQGNLIFIRKKSGNFEK